VKRTKLHERFVAVGIINAWDLLTKFADKAKKEDIAISYHAKSAGAVSTRGSHVWSPSRNLNPKAAWYEYGKMIFYGVKDKTEGLALAWAVSYTNTHVDDWVPNPVEKNGLVLKVVVDRAMEFLKEQEAKKS
jgi:hypothetical protein